MAIKYVDITISKEVSSGVEDSQTYTPANGSTITIISFEGEAAYDPNAAVKLIWDFGGVGEETLWTTKGSSKIPFKVSKTGDGVKKLAVCLDNGMSGPVFMSGHALIEEQT